MRYFVGVDEAGYGPNLGPLVIAASCWSAPDDAGDDLYTILQDAVAKKKPKKGGQPNSRQLVIADSKTVYQGAQRMARLERNVLAALAVAGHTPTSGQDLWTQLTGAPAGEIAAELTSPLWRSTLDQSLPQAAAQAEIQARRQTLAGCLAKTGATLEAVRAIALFPREFNRQTDAAGTKGAVLSHTTINLVAQMLDVCTREDAPTGDIFITCDKHGGRNRYAPLLLPLTGGQLVETHVEGTPESRYRWRDNQRTINIGFFTGGERFLPTALASMAAKYLRELAMQAFNQFWREHIPTLKPTAGYPVDARRFNEETRAVRRKLEIEDAAFWRNR